MIKLLVFLTLIAIISAFSFSQYNLTVDILILSYEISTSLFFIILVIGLLYILLSLTLLCCYTLISIPNRIYVKYLNSRHNKNNTNINQALILGLLGDSKNAIKIAKKFLDSEDIESEKSSAAIMTLSDDVAQRLSSFNKLNKLAPEFSFIINKKLMISHLNENNYREAEIYGKKAFAENEYDDELHVYLITIYSKILNPERALFFVNKLERKYPEKLQECKTEIIFYLFTAADNLINRGNKKEAILFLEKLCYLDPYNVNYRELLKALN